MDCKDQFVWEELGKMTGTSFQWTEKERREEAAKGLTWYHLCTTRNQVWALLMPRTAVRLVVPWPLHCSWTLWWWEGLQEGNMWSIHTLPGGTEQWNYVRAGCLMQTVRATAAACCGTCLPLLLCRTLLFELSLMYNISSTPYMCFSSALLNKVLP